MSTTASDHDDVLDAVRYAYSRMNWLPEPHLLDLYPSPSAYEMVKIGPKEYGFRPCNRQVGSGLVARYKCSHLEARRRFAMMLITRKMMR